MQCFRSHDRKVGNLTPSMSRRIARCVLGMVLAFGCLLGLWPCGGCLIAWRFSGTSIVKVHEWFLVCHGGWLFACATTSTLHTSSVVCLGLYRLYGVLVSCAAYLIDGIVSIDQSRFRLVSSTWHEMDPEAISLNLIIDACVEGVDH